MKADCYKCKYRGDVPGSAHSSCMHPSFKSVNDNPMLGALSIFASVGRVPPIQVESEIKVRGNQHGIKNGWFNHPFNFDPVWLENCDGFIQKQNEVKDEEEKPR